MLSSLLLHRHVKQNSCIGFSTSSGTDNITISTTKNWDGTMYYSTNGSTWHEWNGDAVTGKSLYFRGKNNTVVTNGTSEEARWIITCNSNFSWDGDLETLRGYDGNIPTMGANCYAYMFYNNTKLVSAPTLSATQLASNCYAYMFMGCTALTTAPALPATQLAEYCYVHMFNGCTALRTPPALPATQLADMCYHSMFRGCTSLTIAPALPATTLKIGCYHSMFYNCSSLATAPTLSAMNLAAYCYCSMFWYCTSITTPPVLPATTMAQACYMDIFRGCTGLTRIPKLLATTYAKQCYTSMYHSCSQIKFYTNNSDSSLYTSYKFTGSDVGEGESSAFDMMFTGTNGSCSGDAFIGTQYYCTIPIAS